MLEPAILMVAGVIPMDLLTQEQKITNDLNGRVGIQEVSRRAREDTMNRWQNRWDSDPRGRWTVMLILHLQDWVKQGHGEVNFFTTQFLRTMDTFSHTSERWGKLHPRTAEIKTLEMMQSTCSLNMNAL